MSPLASAANEFALIRSPRLMGANRSAEIEHRASAMDSRLFKERGNWRGSTSKWISNSRQIYILVDCLVGLILLTFRCNRKAQMSGTPRVFRFFIGSLFQEQ
jgi:hypothetical protein